MTIDHQVDGRLYQIRIEEMQQGIRVRTYFGDKQVSPNYLVDFETAMDFKHYTGQRAISALIEIAKSDLDAGIVK